MAVKEKRQRSQCCGCQLTVWEVFGSLAVAVAASFICDCIEINGEDCRVPRCTVSVRFCFRFHFRVESFGSITHSLTHRSMSSDASLMEFHAPSTRFTVAGYWRAKDHSFTVLVGLRFSGQRTTAHLKTFYSDLSGSTAVDLSVVLHMPTWATITRKPSYRWQIRATRKPVKNCSNSTCLQRCRWQYWPIFIRLAVVASEIC